MANFDFIVVGSGSSGGALAARLSEREDCRVLLIEAGGRCNQLPVRIPIAWHPTSENPKYGWDYHTAPEPQINNRTLHQARGKLLGGTSSINGMMYSRGNRGDYDSWAAMGLPGWSYDEVLPYFKRSEANWRGATLFHGDSGPVCVSKNPKEPVVYETMIATAKALGYEELDDFHGTSQTGFGMPDFTVRKGERESTYTGYLEAASARNNLTIISQAQVIELLWDGDAINGVKYVLAHDKDTPVQAFASEVILSAGAFGSPQLLMLSGIGDPNELASVGIECKKRLPAVGRHLKDHPLIALGFKSNGSFNFEKMLRYDQLAIAAARWMINQSGPLGEAPLSVQAYLNTGAENAELPDTQLQISHVSFMARPWFPGIAKGAGNQFTAAAMQLQPKGEGSVTLHSADPFNKPVIKLGLLSHDEDLQAARDMFKFIRRFFATEPLAELVDCELFPGKGVISDEDIDNYIRQTIQTGMHPTSTCRMGIDPEVSVVDAQLRVHGVKGLRVCDTSVMPNVVRGNTSAPAMMIAEKAADMILANMAQPTAEAG